MCIHSRVPEAIIIKKMSKAVSQPASPQVSIFVEVINNTAHRIQGKKLIEFATAALQILGKSHAINFEQAGLVLVFVELKEMQAINKKYRKKNKPTDVLSFGSDEGLGELILCVDVIKEYALKHRIRIQDELTYVVLHGIIHLLGYDHETSAKDARKMFQLQDQLYNRLAEKFSLKSVQRTD